MKKQALVGLAIFLVVGCSNKEVQPKHQERTAVVSENNNSQAEKKSYIIDLDKEIKNDGLKGGAFETLRGLIPLGNNDEVAFVGKKLFIATPIKLYINGKINKTVKFLKGILTIKSSELAVGDSVTIKNRFGVKLVEKKVVK